MKGPIIIGGIGGSGTRVVTSILQVFNIFMGSDLNVPLDNLTYTLLFKRPKWFYKNGSDRKKIETGLSVMEKAMTGKRPYSFKELLFITNALMEMAKYGHNKEGDGKGIWAWERFVHVLQRNNKDISSCPGWGWKEPNSHLLIESFVNYYGNVKYIHAVRHGLDMAFSPNQQQFFNWANLYGVRIPEKKKDIPSVSFSYWVKANKKVIDLQHKLGKNKIYLLNFDKLCINPKQEIIKLIDFLEIEVENERLEQASKIPRIPQTKDRYKAHDLSGFKKEDMEFLAEMGYQLF